MTILRALKFVAILVACLVCVKISVVSVIFAIHSLVEGRGVVRVAGYLFVTMIFSYVCAAGIANLLGIDKSDEKS